MRGMVLGCLAASRTLPRYHGATKVIKASWLSFLLLLVFVLMPFLGLA